MKKPIQNFLKKFIEKNYNVWGIKIETDLPPEFIITEHAHEKIKKRFNCSPNKMYKIMLKAWKTTEAPSQEFIDKAGQNFESGIYKMFNGYVFVFRIRYNNRLGFAQKYLITVFKRKGFQFNT